MTSGCLVAHGGHSLNNKRVLEFAKKNKKTKQQALLEKEKKDEDNKNGKSHEAGDQNGNKNKNVHIIDDDIGIVLKV